MPFQCTEAEWKIMEILWDASPRSMPEITKLLAPATGWTRHTVITLLKRMQEKGTVGGRDRPGENVHTAGQPGGRPFRPDPQAAEPCLFRQRFAADEHAGGLRRDHCEGNGRTGGAAEKRRKKITERPVIWAFQKIKPPTFRSDGRVGGLSVSFHESRPIRRVCPASHTGRKKSPRTAKIQTEVFP